MVLPSTLPPPPGPPHLEPDVLHAYEILAKGYCAARGLLDLAQPNLHRVRYHQERIWSELVPLLDVILESTSMVATRSWCHTVTVTIAELFNRLAHCETLAQCRFVILSISPSSHMGHDANENPAVKTCPSSLFTR